MLNKLTSTVSIGRNDPSVRPLVYPPKTPSTIKKNNNNNINYSNNDSIINDDNNNNYDDDTSFFTVKVGLLADRKYSTMLPTPNSPTHYGPELPGIQTEVLGHSSSVHSFTRTAHSLSCSALLASLAHPAALIHSFTLLTPSLVGK